jgi:hypothetical protein
MLQPKGYLLFSIVGFKTNGLDLIRGGERERPAVLWPDFTTTATPVAAP